MKLRGHLLIELLVVIAIIAIIAAIYYGGGFGTSGGGERPDKLGHTTAGRAVLKARDTVCRDQLYQVRLAVEAQTSGDTPPSSLDQLGLKDKMLRCPIGAESYEYDPSTRKVSCPHVGHENF